MGDVHLTYIDEVNVRVDCDPGILFELADHLTFFAENYKFHPKYKAKFWDGKICLINKMTGRTLFGLAHRIKKFCDSRGYSFSFDDELCYEDVTREELEEFIDGLNIPDKFERREYQIDSILKCIRSNRRTLVSPTACLDPNTVIELDLEEDAVQFLEKTREESIYDEMCRLPKVTLTELKALVDNGFTPKIRTSSGYEKITDTYVKFGPGRTITFDDGDSITASDYHLVMSDQEDWVCWNSLGVGDTIRGKEITNVEIVQDQEWIDFTVDADHQSYEHCGITHHNSGKSFMIYVLVRWYETRATGKSLVIVPTINLVNQMASDFLDYGYDGEIHKSTDGLDKSDDVSCHVCITTWQSLNNGRSKMHRSWYRQWGCVFGDECHGAKAMSLKQIMESMTNTKYRFGTTGTLDGHPLNEATIEGLFGPKYRAVSTRELIDAGYASKLKIKCLVLKYPDDDRRIVSKLDYHDEIKFLVGHEGRNRFIKNLTLGLPGNKLVFFKQRDHGKTLYDAFKTGSDDVFYVDGTIKGEDRERIRRAVEETESAVLLGSLGTTSTGVNIKRLHHMIAGAPQKSRTKVPQSIGRMLRLHESKDHATLYDVVDDLTWRKRQNFALKHFLERVKMYDADQFDYDVVEVELK